MMSIPCHFERFTPARASHHDVTRVTVPPAGFTLVELLVTIVIISILASLSLAGLALSRNQARVVRTETTIRKIHEVIMPSYEAFLSRTVSSMTPSPPLLVNTTGMTPSQIRLFENLARNCMSVIAKRRLIALELPDGWNDLRIASEPPLFPAVSPAAYQSQPPMYSAPALRMRSIALSLPANTDLSNSDAECLWTLVMRGGFADPAIVGHFREDEFGDTNSNGQREFIDGWGKPIRFLRWAPAFVSRYQPAPTVSTDTRSHDAFDPAGLDPLARTTLFPLIFSGGRDGVPDIACRDNEGTIATPNFAYGSVAFDPYFALPDNYPDYIRDYFTPAERAGRAGAHLTVNRRSQSGNSITNSTLAQLGPYAPPAAYSSPFGTLRVDRYRPSGSTPQSIISNFSDDIHNHAMSR